MGLKYFPLQFTCRFPLSQAGKPPSLTCRNSKSGECGVQGSNRDLFLAGQPGEFHFLSPSTPQSGSPAHFQHPDVSSPAPRAAGCEQTEHTHRSFLASEVVASPRGRLGVCSQLQGSAGSQHSPAPSAPPGSSGSSGQYKERMGRPKSSLPCK